MATSERDEGKAGGSSDKPGKPRSFDPRGTDHPGAKQAADEAANGPPAEFAVDRRAWCADLEATASWRGSAFEHGREASSCAS
jgi:hypothetical protein